jgi:predicted permease
VEAAAVAVNLPMRGSPDWWYQVDGRDPDVIGFSDYNLVSPGYFGAIGIPVVQGRDFTWEESGGSRPVAIISESMARTAFPEVSPIGKRINVNMPPDGIWREIIGVVGDVRIDGLSRATSDQMYFPPIHLPFRSPLGLNIVAKSSADLSTLAGPARRVVSALDASTPIDRFETLEQVVAGSEAERTFVIILLSLFAGVALLLATTGLYGVISYTVALRTREIGLRLALGAKPASVLRMVLGQSSVLVGLGGLAGLAGAAVLTRLLTSLLFEVRPVDPMTYGAVAVFLVIVALLTSLVPARRATRIEPILALRAE